MQEKQAQQPSNKVEKSWLGKNVIFLSPNFYSSLSKLYSFPSNTFPAWRYTRECMLKPLRHKNCALLGLGWIFYVLEVVKNSVKRWEGTHISHIVVRCAPWPENKPISVTPRHGIPQCFCRIPNTGRGIGTPSTEVVGMTVLVASLQSRLVLVLLRWQWFVDTIIVITLIAKMAFKYHKNECNFILTLVNLLSLRGFVKRFHGISWFPLIYLFAFPGIL